MAKELSISIGAGGLNREPDVFAVHTLTMNGIRLGPPEAGPFLWRAALTSILALVGVSHPLGASAQLQFAPYATVSPAPAWSFVAGEFTGDSRDDLAAYHPSDGSVWVGRNRGSNFDFHRYATVSPAAGWSFVAGDFTGDGLADLAAYHPSDGSVWVGRNTGSNFVFSQYSTVTPSVGWTFTAGQFDGDDQLDLVGYYAGDGSIFIFENAGTSFIHSKMGTLSPAAGWTVIGGRFTRRARSDLVGYHPSDGTVWVGQNQGSTFAFTQYAVVAPAAGWQFAPGRFAGDDAEDLVAYHPSDGSVWTGFNTGSQFRFVQAATLSPSAAWSIVAGEFAGDSVFDVAAYHAGDGSIWVAASPSESHSTVTLFSEAGLWGDKLTIAASLSDENESVRVVEMKAIDAAKLLNRISSIRLQCGSRPSRVVLYASRYAWGEVPVDSYGINCSAGQTVDVNLHRAEPQLADRVGSVFFVSHARDAGIFPLYAALLGKWVNGLAELPSGAKAKGLPRMILRSTTSFTIWQDFKLDDWKCGGRDAHLELYVSLRQGGLDRYAGRAFAVSVRRVYVDSDWGDAWGCRSEMRKKLRDAATTAAHDVESGLNELLVRFGDDARHYLVPLGWNRSLGAFMFNLYYGQ